jgi:hypothetical protein
MKDNVEDQQFLLGRLSSPETDDISLDDISLDDISLDDFAAELGVDLTAVREQVALGESQLNWSVDD